MKRLYVSPSVRGSGLGLRLVEAVLREAERIGYREIRLDTIPDMAAALSLYRRFGFEQMAPYFASPVAGTVFMQRRMRGSAEGCGPPRFAVAARDWCAATPNSVWFGVFALGNGQSRWNNVYQQ